MKTLKERELILREPNGTLRESTKILKERKPGL
jgi:hypothetical protein